VKGYRRPAASSTMLRTSRAPARLAEGHFKAYGDRQSVLSGGRRKQLHGRIAAILEERFSEIVDSRPEVLAQHCSEAGLIEKAVGYSLESRRQATVRSAMAEAAAHAIGQ
jgi:hypothetical protein